MNKISEKIKKILTTNKNLSSIASAHKGLLLIGSSGIIGSAISAAFRLPGYGQLDRLKDRLKENLYLSIYPIAPQ